jgi:hypothetical protein
MQLRQGLNDEKLIKLRQFNMMYLLADIPNELNYYLIYDKRMDIGLASTKKGPWSTSRRSGKYALIESLFNAIPTDKLASFLAAYPHPTLPRRNIYLHSNHHDFEQVNGLDGSDWLYRYAQTEFGRQHAANTKIWLMLNLLIYRKLGSERFTTVWNNRKKQEKYYLYDFKFIHLFLQSSPPEFVVMMWEHVHDTTDPTRSNHLQKLKKYLNNTPEDPLYEDMVVDSKSSDPSDPSGEEMEDTCSENAKPKGFRSLTALLFGGNNSD